MIFKVTSKEIFGSTAILAKISERDFSRTETIAPDYWNFLPKDTQQGNALKPNERILSPLQVSSSATTITSTTIASAYFIYEIFSIFNSYH